HHLAEEHWHRSRRELQPTWHRRVNVWSLKAPVGRRARGNPRRGQEETPATATTPLMGAPLRWRAPLCPLQQQ
ncbi:hypothetical protein NDU88_005486, partial [Pleurodeles waltl]